MEHRPEAYPFCIANATGLRGSFDQQARVASAVRAASFKRRSVYGDQRPDSRPSSHRKSFRAVRCQFGRSRRTQCAGCIPGSAPSFVPRCAPAGIESAPVRLRRRGRAGHRSCGASLLTPVFAANSLTTCRTSFSATSSPQGLPTLLTRRKTFPVSMPAAFIHSLGWPWTQSGTGTVRT